MGGILIIMIGLFLFIAFVVVTVVILVVGTVKGADALVQHEDPAHPTR